MKLIIFKKSNKRVKYHEIYLKWISDNFQSILRYYLHSPYNSSEFERIIIEESKIKKDDLCIWKINNKGKLTMLNDNQIKKIKSRFVNINNIFNLTEI